MEPLNLRLPEPDQDDHFPECEAIHGEAICVCDEVERSMRDSFAAMKADYRFESSRCY